MKWFRPVIKNFYLPTISNASYTKDKFQSYIFNVERLNIKYVQESLPFVGESYAIKRC